MRNPSSASSTTTKTPCCSKVGLKRGPWTPEEDELLANYIKKEGEGRWRTLPKRAGLLRCGKSCRLRWMNYLRPSVKRGQIAPDEEDLILRLHRLLGNRWSLIAGRIPGRTDNEIKNYWNTHLSKKLISQGIDPRTHKPLSSTPTPTKPSSSSKPPSTNNKNIIIPSSLAPPNPNPSPNPAAAAAAAAAASSASEESNTDSATNAAIPQKPMPAAHVLDRPTAALGYFDDGPNATTHAHYQAQSGMLVSNNGAGHDHLHLHHLDHHHKSALGLTYMSNNNNNHNNNSGNSNGLSPSLDDDDDVNYCTDDVFSSFLNSLINEDMFTAQNQFQHHHHHQQQQQPPPNGNVASDSDTLVSPSPQMTRSAFGFGAGWDAPLMSTASAFNQNDQSKHLVTAAAPATAIDHVE